MFDTVNDILAGLGDIIAEPWFWPAASVILGLPVVLLVLGEIHTSMVRRGNPAARIVLTVRNVLVPLGAVIILFTQVPQEAGNADFAWPKVAATAFGFVVILVLLNGLNLALFVTAREGTWRQRIPSIFVDIARVVLIAVGLAVLFGWIWGADIGGLFTALGVGSIVIGLALQNAVGSVLSGLFLLFEQPFAVGDFILTPDGKGRVVEVNWRATHLDTANGILVIPNSTLSGASFRNLSRATSPYEASDIVRFATDDPPQAVIDCLVEVASGLPERHPDQTPYAIPIGKSKYEINVALTSPAKQYMSMGLFRTRLWYAARRAGLHLDRDLTDMYATSQHAKEQLLRLAAQFHLSPEEAISLVDRGARLQRYGEGEIVQRADGVPDGVRIIVEGSVELSVPATRGAMIPVSRMNRDEVLGVTGLTRQVAGAEVVAATDLAVLFVPLDLIDELVHLHPDLARDMGQAIDTRHALVARALAEAGEPPPASTRIG